MEDKVGALLHGDTRKIDHGIAQSLIDRSKIVAKFAREGKRRRALTKPRPFTAADDSGG
jgi:hypothetical protein